jgi:hypothetical protein
MKLQLYPPDRAAVISFQASAGFNASVRAFLEDEYQACSGIGNGANKKTVVVKRKYPAGAEAHLYFVAFAARLKSCPVTKHCSFIPWAAEPELT